MAHSHYTYGAGCACSYPYAVPYDGRRRVRCSARRLMPSSLRAARSCPQAMHSSIFELAENCPASNTDTDSVALNSLFEIRKVDAVCSQSAALIRKYGAPSKQPVVSITNRATSEQTWYNQARTVKPQTFTSGAAGDGVFDPTDGGKTCDFCDWPKLTAEDVFGRIENKSCVSASNLFKYCSPYHGLILFKHHNPLEFGEAELADLMRCAMEWFRRANSAPGQAARLYPFLLWNCLPRAGASQFHGHAQVLASHTPIPEVQRLKDAQQRWPSFYQDMLKAHRAAGLLCGCGALEDATWAFPHLSSRKDMEVMLYASHLESPSLAAMLHVVLRTLIDDLGALTFNVGVLNIQVQPHGGSAISWMTDELKEANTKAPVVVRVVSRGKLDSKASDFGGLEVFGGASIGHTDPFSIAHLLRARLGSSAIPTTGAALS